MTEHLWPLLELSAESEEELIDAYRDVYVEAYVQADIRDWLGHRIRFHYKTFDHAFSESGNYRLSVGVHDIPFSLARAQRILWIKEVLSLSAGTVQVLAQSRRDSRGRLRHRRTLVVVEERYVVVLQKVDREGYELEFVTAFPADRTYLEKIRRESMVIETKMPQSYGD